PDESQPTALEALREALESAGLSRVRGMLSALTPAEIADLLESLPTPQRLVVWNLVDVDDEGDVLVEVNDEVRETLMREMDSERISAAARHLDLSVLADLSAEL